MLMTATTLPPQQFQPSLQRSLEYYRAVGGTPPNKYFARMQARPSASLGCLLTDNELAEYLAEEKKILAKGLQSVRPPTPNQEEKRQKVYDLAEYNYRANIVFLREIGRLPEEFDQEGIEAPIITQV